jgi:hypothetical protein
VTRGLLVLVALALAPVAAAQDECVDPDDCDGDGYTVADGDCDDEAPGVHPGAEEICDDGIDQDCVGGDDPWCAAREGELLGGSGCGAQGGWAALLLPLPLLGLGRRRS